MQLASLPAFGNQPSPGAAVFSASESTLDLSGDPIEASLPLAMLEAVKAIDTPVGDFDAELVHELRNKRLGLSETVLQQIRRYAADVKAGDAVAYAEVLALARLLGRRPDVDLVFMEAGRRWARAMSASVGVVRKSAARSLPAMVARPASLRMLRKLAGRYMAGKITRQGSSLHLEVVSPVSADSAATGRGCLLYESAFRELLHVLVDIDGAVEHVMCRSRGDSHCEWRADWRRRQG